jgi:hypothetical protein
MAWHKVLADGHQSGSQSKIGKRGKNNGELPSNIFGWTMYRQNHNLKPVARAMFRE